MGSVTPLSYKLSSIMNLLPVFISCVLSLAAAEVSGRQADTDNHRAGKLFFVATTVSTISTSTLCYTAAANLAACTGRRKRNINSHWDQTDDILEITPVQPVLETADKRLDSGLKESEQEARDARFLLYYATSTTTSYTGTSTLGTLDCTPSSFTLSAC